MTILPLTYLGNIEYFSALCSGGGGVGAEKGRGAGGDVVIDLGENYVRQTYRNRCEIMTVSGATSLTVNVVKGRSATKRAMKDMKIDYSKRWRHQHSVSLVSAYKNSPYFDHYWDLFQPIYEKRFTCLADLDRELLDTLLTALKLAPHFTYSEDYVIAGPEDNDLRGHFSNSGHNYPVRPYFQVFGDRIPFTPNLSVIDLLFCEGPAAAGTIWEFGNLEI